MKIVFSFIILTLSSSLFAQMDPNMPMHEGMKMPKSSGKSPFISTKQNYRIITETQIKSLEDSQDKGKASGTAIIFDGREAHVIIRTGPADDMLSYRIQGIRNPT